MNGLPSITEILSITKVIGAADLLAFAGGAIEVVPPPGDGKLAWLISAFLQYNFDTVDFAFSPVLSIRYAGSGDLASVGQVMFLPGNGESAFAVLAGATNAGDALLTSGDLNQGLDLALDAGAFALGGIGSASISAAGTGYAIGDTGTVTTGNGDATYEVLTIGALGVVATFKITFPGSGYSTGAGQATATGGSQPGVGINFTVDVLTIVNGDGSLKVTTLYQVIDVP